MINHESPGRLVSQTGFSEALDAVPSAGPWYCHVRVPRHLWHLPRDYELAIRWLRPSFSHEITGRPAGSAPGLTFASFRRERVCERESRGTDKKYNCSAAGRFGVPDRICALQYSNFKSAALPTGYP